MVYVDDILIASNNVQEVEALKVSLDQHFKLKDLGGLKYFLGLKIARSAYAKENMLWRFYRILVC